ncbi:MAG: BolA family protein [Oxalobacteraceae bacterium]
MSARLDAIRARLIETFDPAECHLVDDSARHAGHAGAASGGGHFTLHIVSRHFEGQSRLSRHRLVYDSLRNFMHSDIHALAITALAPSEIQ